MALHVLDTGRICATVASTPRRWRRKHSYRQLRTSVRLAIQSDSYRGLGATRLLLRRLQRGWIATVDLR
jgi:hypothetical protein